MTATVIPLRQPEPRSEEAALRERCRSLTTVRTSTLIACLANTTDEIERGAIIREIARER